MNRNLLVLSALALVSVSQAQSNLLPTNMNLRLGATFPLETNTRDFTGTLFGIGADIPTSLRIANQLSWYFSMDFMTGSLDGKRGWFVPVMYNARLPLGQTSVGESTYLFGGAGLVHARLGGTETVWGFRGGLGLNLGENTFAEATMWWSDSINGGHLNAISVHYGMKF
ncbi:MAG: hypothetical protein JNK63_00285 [Chthonomonas sp.]|nr:hypothetical protein [Chthonomonas sp.]